MLTMKIFKVFVAVVLGSAIGGLTALKLNLFLVWWLGLGLGASLGGVVGYASFEFREVIRAVRTVLQRFKGRRIGVDRLARRTLIALMELSICVTIFITGATMLGALGGIVAAMAGDLHPLLAASGVLGAVLVAIACREALERDNMVFRKREPTLRELGQEIFLSSPFSLFTYHLFLALRKVIQGAPKYIPLVIAAVWVMAVGIPKAGALIISFIKEVVVLIHSELRLLCFVWAFMGSLLVFLLDSVLLGAVLGGLLGSFNHYLVGVQLLGLHKNGFADNGAY